MAADRAKALNSMLNTLRSRGVAVALAPEITSVAPAAGDDVFHGDLLLTEFTYSFLLWGSTSAKATAAMARVRASFVDINELRVSLVDEIASSLGRSCPQADERATRLKAALNDLFSREHRVRLDQLGVLGKNAALGMIGSLAQTPRFVAARTALVGLGAHAMPVDGRLLSVLIDAKIVAPDADLDAAADSIERMIPAGDLREAYALLQGAADAHEAAKPLSHARPSGKSAGRAARASKSPPISGARKRG
jgi:hypothetical protein